MEFSQGTGARQASCYVSFDAGSLATDFRGTRKFSKGIKVPHSADGKPFFDGAWIEWEWNGQRLTANTSPHGMLPLYFLERDHSLALSTNLLDLLEYRENLELDFGALAVFLRLGNFLGTRTLFKEIKTVPAGATLTWSAGVTEIVGGNIVHASNLCDLSREEAVDRYIDLMSSAVRRRLPTNDFVVPVSAGRDSRHILLELLKNGYKPTKLLTSSHYLSSSGVETRVARTLAELTDCEISVIQPNRNKVAAQCEVQMRTDLCVIDHQWTTNLAQEISKHPLSYDGLNGGVLFGRTKDRENLDSLYRADRLEELADRILRKNEEVLSGILSREVLECVPRDLAIAETITELAQFKESSNRLIAFLHANHVRRRTAHYTYRMIDHGNVLCPLDDFDIVSFALSLPAELANDAKLQKDATLKAFPQFKSLPFEEDLRHEWSNGSGMNARRHALTIARNLAQLRSSKLLNKSWIAKRLTASLVKGQRSPTEWWHEPAIYLIEATKFAKVS